MGNAKAEGAKHPRRGAGPGAWQGQACCKADIQAELKVSGNCSFLAPRCPHRTRCGLPGACGMDVHEDSHGLWCCPGGLLLAFIPSLSSIGQALAVGGLP